MSASEAPCNKKRKLNNWNVQTRQSQFHLPEDELKLQQRQWDQIDPTWKIAWSKDRCEHVLRNENSEANIIEYAKMYYKHWLSMEYYANLNKNDDSRKRKRIGDMTPFEKLKQKLLAQSEGGCPIHKEKDLYFKDNAASSYLKMYCKSCNDAELGQILNPEHIIPPVDFKRKYNELKKESSKQLKQSKLEYERKMNELKNKNKELLNENAMCYGQSDKINTLTIKQINELENKLKNGINVCNEAKEKKVECNICLENRANAYIMTCKHCPYCIQCEGKLSDDKKICAICNTPYAKLDVMTINW